MHRLFLDVKVAAARTGYYLNTYFDDVDHDGFDVIFDDQDYIKKIQVKSVGINNSTKSWSIHKRILRPSLNLIDKLGFEFSPTGEGTEGGVILIEYEDNNGSLDATYYYTDVFILLAFEHELLRRTHASSQQAVHDCLKEWRIGLGNERVTVPRAAFLKAKDAAALLALLGLHSTASFNWKHGAIQLVNHIGGDRSMELPAPLDKLKISVWEEVRKLVNEPKMEGPSDTPL